MAKRNKPAVSVPIDAHKHIADTHEPAAELIARIRAGREQPAPKPARTRKPKADRA